MKDVFIINPKGQKKEQLELIHQIQEVFQGRRIIIEKTNGPGHARFIAQKYALKTEEPVHLYACGGDGTLHEVVNGMAQAPHIYLSILPIGTGNDFIKSFEGLTKQDFLDLSAYQDAIEMDCDLLKVNGEYALNSVSIGFDVHVADAANKTKKIIPKGGIFRDADQSMQTVGRNLRFADRSGTFRTGILYVFGFCERAILWRRIPALSGSFVE